VKDSVSYYDPGYGWEIVSHGQPAIYQSLSVGAQVGDPSGYNPAAAEDAVNDPGKITGNAIQFLTVSQSNGDGVKDPVTLYMQSTKAFQGPFDIVAFLSGKGGSVEVSVCTDTIAGEWTVSTLSILLTLTPMRRAVSTHVRRLLTRAARLYS